MTSRRTFIKTTTLATMATHWAGYLGDFRKQCVEASGVNWEQVRTLFPIASWEHVHLNSGSAGVMPDPVTDYLIEQIRYLNSKPPYVVWGEWQEIKKNNLKRLSALVGSEENELQIVRNTTEALNMIIYGLPLQKGDEVIIAKHDYPFARNAWLNRQKRDSVQLKELDIILPGSVDEVLQEYKRAISPRTKVIHLTHVTHREGHIMPIKAITQLAHEHNIEIVVDGAHVVGHLEVDLSDLNCDYFASSLHKWLNAPLGTGLLYVRKDHVEQLQNHPSSNLDAFDSMNKYEHLGTRAWSNEIGISAALDFHDMIGFENKRDRLQELKMYWTKALSEESNISFQTDLSPEFSGGVTTVKMKDYSGGKLARALMKDHGVHVKSVGGSWGSGVRVSPNIFTNFADLDQFVTGMINIART